MAAIAIVIAMLAILSGLTLSIGILAVFVHEEKKLAERKRRFQEGLRRLDGDNI